MNVLVIGGGGREHVLAWKVSSSPLVEQVFVAPGNAGTHADSALSNVAIDVGDHDSVAAFCEQEEVKLVIIGPEAPLVAGLADTLRRAGLDVVGPNADGAVLEGSKAFAKDVMKSAGVPTARYAECTTIAQIDAFCDSFDGEALVVKADGLAAGKGVIVCDDVESARVEAKRMLQERTFGDASARLVLEERLEGIETSYIVLAARGSFIAFPTSQDHKRLLDGDQGPNTGGMGAFSPAPFVSEELAHAIEESVIQPTLHELQRRGIDFRGFLYAGIMLTADGPRVLEFNVRLGDPEAQVLLRAIEGDVVPAFIEAAQGHVALESFGPTTASAVVVMAAEGYPKAPVKGAKISGLRAADALEGVKVIHAGTRLDGDDVLVSGGRVLGVSAVATTPEEAVERAYAGVELISWPGAQHRTDIGKALKLG